MKKIILIAILIIFSVASVRAQHDVRVNAFGLFLKHYGVGYEYIINDELGTGVFINYSTGIPVPIMISYVSDAGDPHGSYSVLTISPEFRFYTNPEDGADGFYFAGYLRYKSSEWVDLEYKLNGSSKIEYYNLNYNGLMAGFSFGKKWMTNSGLYIESYFGVGKSIIGKETNSNYIVENDLITNGYIDKYSQYSGWDFRFNISLGYRIGGY